MFNHPPKKILSQAHLQGLTVLIPASQLLLKNKRLEKLAEISKVAQLAPSQFQSLCTRLAHTLLNYTQQLPDTTNSYFSSPGGAFDHALSRTHAASELFQSFLLQDPTEQRSEIQQCWWYALFSAGLLRGIGKLPSEYAVQIYSAQGHLIKSWKPLLEPLFGVGYAYQFETIHSNHAETFQQRLNIILAQQLIPKEGFAWLTQHLDVFEVWLALLHEDTASSGSLGLILDRADDIAIQEDLLDKFNENAPKHGVGQARSFIETPGNIRADREQHIAAAFIHWLHEKLESGKLTFNQHPLLHVAGGTLIGPDTFKLFVRESPQFKNELAVIKSLQTLNLCDNSAAPTTNNSVILKGSLALPENFQHKTSSSADVTKTNAIDARHPHACKQLSSDGQWQNIEVQKTMAFAPKNT